MDKNRTRLINIIMYSDWLERLADALNIPIDKTEDRRALAVKLLPQKIVPLSALADKGNFGFKTLVYASELLFVDMPITNLALSKAKAKHAAEMALLRKQLITSS